MTKQIIALVALLSLGLFCAVYAETSTVEVPFESHGQTCNFDEIAVNHNINRLLPKTLINKKSLYSSPESEIVWSHIDQTFDVRSNSKLNQNSNNQTLIKLVESIYPDIRNLLENLKEFQLFPDSNSLTKGEDWKWIRLEGRINSEEKIKKVFDSLEINTHFGFYPFISKLEPDSYIASHCGSTTFRHRIHLGISIPEPKEAFIMVNNVKFFWEEGKAFIFDDSLIHEVKHDGKLARVVLILDIWPNELNIQTRKYLKKNSLWLKNLCLLSS